jgi:hypothetical protein
MTMRRLALMSVLVAVLAGCSSGSSNVAGSTKSTSPTGTSSTSPKGTSSKSATVSPKIAPKTAAVPIGGATSFCEAFKELQGVKASDGAAAAGAAYRAAAANMRKYAPTAIKGAATTYATVIDDAGKALASKTMPTRMAGKPADLATVTAWVTKNCPKK